MSSAKGDESTFFAHFKMRIGHEYLDRSSEISSSMSDEMTGSKKKELVRLVLIKYSL